MRKPWPKLPSAAAMARPAALLLALLLLQQDAAEAKKKVGKVKARGPTVESQIANGNLSACLHCQKVEPLTEFLRRNGSSGPASAAAAAAIAAGPAIPDSVLSSDVHVLWPSLVEVINITTDIGGWEDPSFHQALADEAIRGWRDFRIQATNLPKGHTWRESVVAEHAGSLNDAFFAWQSTLFEQKGDVQRAFRDDSDDLDSLRDGSPGGNTTWPGMNGLWAYKKLRKYVDKFGRRYLERAGMKPDIARSIETQAFSWVAVNSPGEFHSPHTHTGEYHVAVFYASVGPSAGKLLFGDPRGLLEPFDKSYSHTPKAGQLVLFPSWLGHMATVTKPSSSLSQGKEPLRVIFSFNVGPGTGSMDENFYWSDPLADVRFQRKSPIDLEGLGLKKGAEE